MGIHIKRAQKLLRLVINMSRKKKIKEEPVDVDVYQVPPEIENMSDDLVLSKPLVVKIIKDMMRGERERYKRYVLDVSSLAAKVSALETTVGMLGGKRTKMTPKVEEVRIDRMDDELTGLNERINEIDDTVDTIISAYNCMQDYPKHSSYKSLSRDRWELEDDDESSKDSPPAGLVNCAVCVYRIDEFSSRGYKYDALYGRCCCKNSVWFRQMVFGDRHCVDFYAAIKGLPAASGTSSNYRAGSHYKATVPLRSTDKPIFFGYDLTASEGEEFQCLKD